MVDMKGLYWPCAGACCRTTGEADSQKEEENDWQTTRRWSRRRSWDSVAKESGWTLSGRPILLLLIVLVLLWNRTWWTRRGCPPRPHYYHYPSADWDLEASAADAMSCSLKDGGSGPVNQRYHCQLPDDAWDGVREGDEWVVEGKE